MDDIVSAPDSSVWGLVYKLTQQDLGLLDSFEGKGKAYDRMTVQVRFLDGRMVEAETYCVIDKQEDIQPGEEYLDLILKAARKHTFPEQYVAKYIRRE